MAQKIQDSIPDQIYANINLHSDSENIDNENVMKDDFPATSSEIKASKKSNSLQRFFWRKKSESDEPTEINNSVDSEINAFTEEKKFLHSKRMHLHLGRHIPKKRSDSLPKREHGEMDLLKKSSSSVSKGNEKTGTGLRAYFSTYWNYIFSKNKNTTNMDEIYDITKPSQTDDTETKLKSVISNCPNTEKSENLNIAVE